MACSITGKGPLFCLTAHLDEGIMARSYIKIGKMSSEKRQTKNGERVVEGERERERERER